eukprot:TRINITY_DN3609_c0_g2_i2.p1 TRINITY_DN3609_c0_g2~~TRINITY_DN3609_c0_g2_i2.p1  ORF type:complete len:877 (-),score=137.79 TRINITY_DN3609_c0_g2_i2:1078-3708(-)
MRGKRHDPAQSSVTTRRQKDTEEAAHTSDHVESCGEQAADGMWEELSPVLLFEDVSGLIALARTGAESDSFGVDLEAPREELVMLLRSLPPSEYEDFWQRSLQAAAPFLHDAPRCSPSKSVNDGVEVKEGDELAANAIHALASVLAAFAEGALDDVGEAPVALNTSQAEAEPFMRPLPPSLAQAASQLQDLLLQVPHRSTQSLIASALQNICIGAFIGREDFYGGVLMFLVGRCLEDDAANESVTKLYKVRSLFGELDWEHESIDSMKLQLMRCTSNPRFARATHGADLIALFYTVHPDFTGELHGTIKNQAVYSRATALKAFGISLFKAWTAADGETQAQLEGSIQDWAVLAIRAARRSAEKARLVLEEVHRHHHEDAVNDMLCRIYGPILFRSMKVANCQVRENAVKVLQYVFPLIKSALAVADKEQELVKQLRLLRDALDDSNDLVRCAAVRASCLTLKNYWNMLPPGEIAELLTVMMSKCGRDKRSPLLRAAVCEGFGWILSKPVSHPTMAAVLPQTAELLNDRSPHVRAAFVHLLSIVSSCRSISVQTVTKNEDLLIRLVYEHAEGQAERLQKMELGGKRSFGDSDTPSADSISRLLAKLMAPSLFGQELVQQVTRCKFLMQHWPLALLALLTQAKDIVAAPHLVKLAAALFKIGLREAQQQVSGTMEQPKSDATLMRVVGVLLEGASNSNTKSSAKRRRTSGGCKRLPKELECFVYEHICEDDFLQLLEDRHDALKQLVADLLFVLSMLDASKFPRTAAWVSEELSTMSQREGSTSAATTQLRSFLQLAKAWDLLEEALDPSWQGVLGLAEKLRHRRDCPDTLRRTLPGFGSEGTDVAGTGGSSRDSGGCCCRENLWRCSEEQGGLVDRS